MKKPASIALLLLASACATPGSGPARVPSAGWIRGTWLLMETDTDRSLVACASGLPIVYRPDGTYGLWEEDGVWRLDGDRLTETATEVNEVADPSEVAIGRPQVSRIERIGPDEMRKVFADGSAATLLRCPKP